MKIKENISLKNKTTFKIGGKARYYCEPKTLLEMKSAFDYSKLIELPVFVIGGGANVLFGDDTIEKLVISTKRLKKIEPIGNCVKFDAGVSIDKATKYLLRQGLSGFEFASGLPGSIGGAVYMNARCYGSEVAELVKEVTVYDSSTGEIRLFQKDELGYGYKKSIFMEHPEYTIVNVVMKFKEGDYREMKQVIDANRGDRKSKGQYSYPSAGCVFKNDYKVGTPAGKLIDDVGLKGENIGGAFVYENHANFIVNKKDATARDVKSLIDVVRTRVKENLGVELELELQIVE